MTDHTNCSQKHIHNHLSTGWDVIKTKTTNRTKKTERKKLTRQQEVSRDEKYKETKVKIIKSKLNRSINEMMLSNNLFRCHPNCFVRLVSIINNI